MTEPVTTGQKENKPDNMVESKQSTAEQRNFLGRKEKRKALKKDKRKQIRKELAAKARAEEEARLNDPEEQRKIQLEEDRENERLERERKEFEERERIFLQDFERKKKEEEEDERIKAVERESKLKQEGAEEVLNEDDEWEYVEEGPPEIIWQGNEIIVKKNKVKVKKKEVNQDMEKEDPNRPTSNPLPPQSEAYAAYKSAPVTSAALMDTVAQQVPNFGTEQDKSHCPFHIKTGACRFGSRCNRVHYYPDKSTTLLIKNMYNGPGLAWDQDEGLEYTEEEVEGSYEEFYEDVHTEFLKFGEIINFKVCRNGSFHLRGNVYIQYKSMDSAVMAYNSVQGRYFAAKQVKCEFVSLTRWKVAICGEYMKSRLKTCSRGSACNFLHCFSNPGGDYEWADCDKPPPRYWIKKMSALFGYSDDYWHDKHIDEPSPKHSTRISTSDRDSYYDKKRQRSTETNQHNRSSSRNHHRVGKRRYHEDETNYKYNNHNDEDTDSDGDRLNTHRRHRDGSENHSAHYRSRSRSRRDDYDRHKRTSDSDEEDLYKDKTHVYPKHKSRHRKYDSESSSSDEKESNDAKVEAELQRHNKPHKIRYHHGRSTTKHNRDEEEPYIKKQKTSRSRSRNSSYLLDNHDTSDRWDPNTSPDEHSSGKEHNRKPKDKRSSRETRSGGEVNKFRTKAANSS